MHHTQQHLLSPIIFSRARNDHDDDDGDGVDNGREEQLESTLVTSYFPGHVVGDCMRTRHELFVFLGRSVGRCSNLGLLAVHAMHMFSPCFVILSGRALIGTQQL